MSARVTFIGDTLLGSKAQPTLDREGYGYALAGLAPLLVDSDLVIANHEGPVSADAPAAAKSYGARRPSWRCADPTSLQALLDAGVRVVGLSNNHILDHGAQGLCDTVEALDAAGIAHCGAGTDDVLARRAVELTVGGQTIEVTSGMAPRAKYVEAGYYAAPGSPGPALLEAGSVPPGAAALRIVLAHWGPGYGPVDEQQRELAAELLDAGAQLVVGTHPHTPQPVDVTRGAPVLFSLGNGAYGSMGRFSRHRAEPYGLVATVEIGDAGVLAIELRTILTDNKIVAFQPRPVDDDRARTNLSSLLDPDAGWTRIAGGARWQREVVSPPGSLSTNPIPVRASPVEVPARRILRPDWANERMARVQRMGPTGDVPDAVGGWLAVPARCSPQARLAVVMHGVLRNAREYLEIWRAWSQRTGRPVLAPHFDADAWPGARGYNLGNVLCPDGRLNPRSAWAFTALRHLVIAAQGEAGSPTGTWDLFGHSAGAQFAHRYALLGTDPTLGRVAVAGAGWFTLPDPAIDWPYGTRHSGLGVDESTLTRWVRRPLVLLRGEHDRVRDGHLRVSPAADAQGPTRWHRAAYMLAAGRAQDPGCSWELIDVAGAGHKDEEIAPVVQALWDPPNLSALSALRGEIDPIAFERSVGSRS